jgi:hypothetical protein
MQIVCIKFVTHNVRRLWHVYHQSAHEFHVLPCSSLLDVAFSLEANYKFHAPRTLLSYDELKNCLKIPRIFRMSVDTNFTKP